MSELRPIVVYGAGGLGREVEFLIRRINAVRPQWKFEGYVVTNRSSLGENDSSDQIVGDETWLLSQEDLCVAVGIGTPMHRVAIGRRLQNRLPDSQLPSLVDPFVVLDEQSCKLAPGAIVTAGNILTVNIRLDPFCYINLDCTLGHEATIGFGSVLNPSVNVSGGVVVEEGVLVGTGAQLLQYARIGAGATVGAGALVRKDVEPGTTVVGVPAKPRA